MGAIVTIALFGAFGASMALAATGPGYGTGSPTITCTPNDPGINSGCQVEFIDVSYSNGNTGLVVCFTTTGTNTVVGKSGNCSPENAGSEAFATIQALQCGSATITGVENTNHQTATVTVDVVCAPPIPYTGPSPVPSTSASPVPNTSAPPIPNTGGGGSDTGGTGGIGIGIGLIILVAVVGIGIFVARRRSGEPI